MYVCKPTKTDGIRGYVSYTLSGPTVPFEVQRRFSDFFALREKLLERWPGIYVPNIPPKKTIGNRDEKLIATRIRLLNKFLLRLSKIPFLFTSEEVKVFKLNITDITKVLNSLPKLQYNDLLKRYAHSIQGYQQDYNMKKGKEKLTEFNNFLHRALKSIRVFHEVIENSKKKNSNEIEKYIKFISVLEEHEKVALLELVNNNEDRLVFSNCKNTNLFQTKIRLRESFTNPYMEMSEWLEEEEIDMQAMNDAIMRLENMSQLSEKMMGKIEGFDMEQGKKRLLSGVFDIKDTKGIRLLNEKVSNELEVCAMKEVVSIAYYNMEVYIQKYKEEIIKQYHKNLKVFANLQKDNNKLLDGLWIQVKKVLGNLRKDEQE